MPRFEDIRIRGYRRLRDVSLKLRPLNVLIGANGSGKTSLLDVFTLLAESARGRLSEAISEAGGFDSICTNLKSVKGGKATNVQFDLTSRHTKTLLNYSVSLVSFGIGYKVHTELLSDVSRSSTPKPLLQFSDGVAKEITNKANVLIESDLAVAPGSTFLSQAVSWLSLEVKVYREFLKSSTHYHVVDVGPRSPIRMPQPLRTATLPGRDGEDLVSCLYGIRENDPERFELIEATLRSAFPNFERLNFPAVAAGLLAMTWKDTTSKHPFYMNQLSEGTLRFLWLVTLLQSPGLTSITMIDEPEVSLHPELLSLLAELFREASQRTQLIVATHADRLVRALKPEEVVTVSSDESGEAVFQRADEHDLESWLEEYTLDQVWGMGRIGGRP